MKLANLVTVLFVTLLFTVCSCRRLQHNGFLDSLSTGLSSAKSWVGNQLESVK